MLAKKSVSAILLACFTITVRSIHRIGSERILYHCITPSGKALFSLEISWNEKARGDE